jgi:KDO2-lipid IV(A) lauroyltransferase
MSPPFLQRTKNHLIYLGVRALVSTLGFLPLGLLGFMGRSLGRMGFYLAGKERRKTLENLRVAFGDSRNKKDLWRLAVGCWENLGRNAFEMIAWSRWPRDRVAGQVSRALGWELMEAALKRGKGVFAVTAHLGHWELLAAYVGTRTPIAVVAKPLYDPRLDRMITDFRAQWGGPVIQRGGALRGILKALSENRTIGVLMDQDTGDDGVFVPFFGREAWTQSGPARIAMKTGAALVPVFLIRGRDGRFELHVEPELDVPDTGDPDADVRETVRRYTEVIEGYVRAYPDQWVWMHDRWRTRPKVR